MDRLQLNGAAACSVDSKAGAGKTGHGWWATKPRNGRTPRRLQRLRYDDVTTDRQSSVIDWCGGVRAGDIASRPLGRSLLNVIAPISRWRRLNSIRDDDDDDDSASDSPVDLISLPRRPHLTTCPFWFHRSYSGRCSVAVHTRPAVPILFAILHALPTLRL